MCKPFSLQLSDQPYDVPMDTKRSEILAAALDAFQEDGLKGVRMSHLAARAQVSKRTLYKHFDNKEALFEAILSDVVERLASMEIPAFDPAKPFKEQLAAVLRAYMRNSLSPEFLKSMRVLLAEFLRSSELAQKYGPTLQEVDVPIMQFLRDAMREGVIETEDPQEAAMRLLGYYKNTVLLPILFNTMEPPNNDKSPEIEDMSARNFLNKSLQKSQ